jgi:hypothetical protein
LRAFRLSLQNACILRCGETPELAERLYFALR